MWRVGQTNERHFEIWFSKKKTITFFWSKLSKLHKKDSILHMTTHSFPKTRGNKNKQWTHSTPLTLSISSWGEGYFSFTRMVSRRNYTICQESSKLIAHGPNITPVWSFLRSLEYITKFLSPGTNIQTSQWVTSIILRLEELSKKAVP